MEKVFVYVFLLLFVLVRGQETDSLELDKANELYQAGRKYLFKNKDSVYHYYQQSYKIFKHQKDWLNAVQILKGITYASSYHYDLNTFGKTLDKIDSILEVRSSYFDSLNRKKSLVSRQLIEKTAYYSKIKNYDKVRSNALELIQIIEQIPDSIRSFRDIETVSSAYEYLAGSYKYEGEYIKAEELYQKSLRLILKHLDEDFAMQTYNLIGDLYRKKGEYHLSNEYLSKRLNQELAKENSSKNRIVKSCFAIADNHIQLQQQDSARYYLNITQQHLLEKDPLQFQYHEMLGKTYLSENKSKEAITEFDTAIILLATNDANLKNVETARLFSLKAEGFYQASDYIKALENYQLAFSKLATDFEYQNLTDNPEISTVQNKYEYLKILIKKTASLQAVDAKGALQSVQKAIALMDELLPTFENEEDKQFLIDTFYQVFDIGISAAFQLYKETNDTTYLDTAFFLSEKSKSTILLEAVLNSRAYQFSNIPDEILEQERQLKSLINYLQKKVTKKKKGQNWEDRLLAAKTEYYDLIAKLENQYPSYYNLKYNNEVIDIKDFQNTLDKNSVVISYFLGRTKAYLIAVSQNGKDFIEIGQSEELDIQILKAYNELIDPTSEIAVVQKSTKDLYAKLLQPVLSQNKYNKLIIIPDGKLHYIPFEGLYDGSNYIVENYTVSYTNSVTLLQQLENGISKNKDFFGFAPSFSKKYTPLVSSESEIENIQSFFDGEVYKGTEATADLFKEKSPLSGILHLATHAIIDDQIPENSHLVFSPKSKEEKLDISDIYALPINAALVSLSACETGIGNLKKGEGMISLSRAFFYAGASSIASTKWQINDRSTSDIMQNFYQHLAAGKRKDEALRLAKLDFLKKNYDNNYRHPYYWSGLIITGSTYAIDQKTPLWVWFTIPVVLVIIGLLFFRRKRNN